MPSKSKFGDLAIDEELADNGVPLDSEEEQEDTSSDESSDSENTDTDSENNENIMNLAYFLYDEEEEVTITKFAKDVATNTKELGDKIDKLTDVLTTFTQEFKHYLTVQHETMEKFNTNVSKCPISPDVLNKFKECPVFKQMKSVEPGKCPIDAATREKIKLGEAGDCPMFKASSHVDKDQDKVKKTI